MHRNQIKLVMRFILLKSIPIIQYYAKFGESVYSNCVSNRYECFFSQATVLLYKFHLRSAVTLKVEQCRDKVKASCL